MDLILVHGDDNLASLDRFLSLVLVARKRNWDVIRLDSKNYLDLSERMESSSLFEKERLFVIENIFSLGKEDIKFISENKEKIKGSVLIYSQSSVPVTLLNQFKGFKKIEEFKIKRTLFSFLDSFYPGQKKNLLRRFNEELGREPVELIFNLLSNLVRDLLWIKVSPKTLNYPAWRMAKLKSQSDKFTLDGLKKLLTDFAKIDCYVKSSRADLASSLDLVILTKL